MRRIPLIPRQRANVRVHDLARVALSHPRGTYHRAALREALASLTTHKHVLLAASGRGALLALLATSGRSRAVVPGYTCKAVAESATFAGLTVDPIDVSDGYNWSAADVAGAAGIDTVVVVTHQFGIAGDVDGVVRAARDAGALVVEDCAAGLGGRSKGRRLGSFGHAAFYSFDLSKLVHIPLKGGALTLSDAAWARRAEEWIERETRMPNRGEQLGPFAAATALALTDRPLRYRLLHTALLARRGRATTDDPALATARGSFHNLQLAEWQAALGVRQIARVDDLAADARRRYAAYRDALLECRTISLPPADEHEEWSPIRFPIQIRGDKLQFYRGLLDRGVDCAFSFTYLAQREGLARSTELADHVLDLPFYPELTDAEAARVVWAVRDLDRQFAA